ncbi:hypothetical protein Tco_1476274 [Tanacetum coccineum]
MGKSNQTLRMLTNEQSLYRENKRKIGLGYTDPFPLGQAIACNPNIYDAEVLGLHYVKPDVHDTKEILNDAEESQVKMKEKQFHLNYERNFYDTFVSPPELSPEQEYFSDPYTSLESESSKEMLDLPIPKMANESKLLKLFEIMDNAIWAMRGRIDKTLLEDTKRRWMSDNQNSLREFYKTNSYVEIKNKEELERFLKESKDSDKFCNDVVEVKEKLSKRIVQLEKDFAKLEAQSIAFQIALQHKTQENNSLKTL